MIKQFFNKLLNFNKGNETKEGSVKFYNKTKKFGFISLKDSDEEFFVHASNVIGKIKKNDKVTFEIEKGDKGLCAVNVSVLK